MKNRIFDYEKIILDSDADRLFRRLLGIIEESSTINHLKKYSIEEISKLIPESKTHISNLSSYKYAFMSMFSGQKGRDYFIYSNTEVQKWFTDTCNNQNRDNLAWKKEKAFEEVRINPKYILTSTLKIYDEEQDSITQSEQEHVKFIEGASKKVLVNAYERNQRAREKCIKHNGYKCSVCEKVLADVYGEIAKEFIHVHHIKPLCEIDKQYNVDPIKDLKPVCPNCHAILHRSRPALSIEELKDIIHKVRK